MPDDVESPEVAEEPSLRDALSAGWDKAEAPEAPVEAVAAPEAKAEAPEPAKAESAPDGRVRDEKGRFLPKSEAAEKGTPAPTLTAPEAPAAGIVPGSPLGTPPPAPVLPEFKAPSSWKPAAREAFAKAPREVQEEALRIDREVRQTMQESAEVKKQWQSFQQTSAPYEAMLRSEGVEPVKAFGLLLQREQLLRTAPLQTRAQILAAGVKTFLGTDENAIKLLAEAIDGQPKGSVAPQQVDPQQIIAQAKAELARELASQAEQRAREAAAPEVDSFAASHDFFDDVREDVADILELAAKRGKVVSLQDAYDRACKMNPEVSKILQQREAAKAAGTAQASIQRAKAAGSSIKSSTGGAPNGAQPKDDSWRAHLEAQYVDR